MATGSGQPTAGFVYKLVAHQDHNQVWHDVAKKSQDKTNHGGRKNAVRKLSAEGVATAELIGAVEATYDSRELVTDMVIAGDVISTYTGASGAALARDFHKTVRREIPVEAIPTEFH